MSEPFALAENHGTAYDPATGEVLAVEDVFDVAEPPRKSPSADFIVNGRYKIISPHSGKKVMRTRASTFAKSIADTYMLTQWQLRMAVKGVSLRHDLYALAAATDPDDRETLQQIAEDAKDAAAARASANLGTALHSFTEKVDAGDPVHIPEPWQKDVQAYQDELRTWKIQPIPEYIERIVWTERPVSTVGKLDRLFLYQDELVLGDVKTGRDLSYGWNEIVIQQALYANASYMMRPNLSGWEAMPPVNQQFGFILHLPIGQGQCTIYKIDLKVGLEGVKLAEKVRRWRNRKNIAELLSVSQPPNPPRQPTYAERLRVATTAAEMSQVYKEAVAAGSWTPALARVGRQRKAELNADKP